MSYDFQVTDLTETEIPASADSFVNSTACGSVR